MYHIVIFVPIDKVSILILISRCTDQEIRNIQAQDCTFTVIDDCEAIAYLN